MPSPVSVTLSTAERRTGSTSRRTAMLPPSRVNFTALLSRLVTARSRWVASPFTRTASGGIW